MAPGLAAAQERQVTGIRGQQDNENVSLEGSLGCQEAGGTVIYYIII